MASDGLKRRAVQDKIIEKIKAEEPFHMRGWFQLFENDFLTLSISFADLGDILLELENESLGGLTVLNTQESRVYELPDQELQMLVDINGGPDGIVESMTLPCYRVQYRDGYLPTAEFQKKFRTGAWKVAGYLAFNPESGELVYKDKRDRLSKDKQQYRFISLLFSNPHKTFSYAEIAGALEKGGAYDEKSKSARHAMQMRCGEILKEIRGSLQTTEDYFVASNGYALIAEEIT